MTRRARLRRRHPDRMHAVAALVAWIAAQGGVAHSSTARRAGHSEHTQRCAVAEGRLRRVRRSWLVAREADARLVRAAECGGRLTCVSAAARRGWWTPRHDRVHVAVLPSASRARALDVVLHWAPAPAPTGRFDTVDPVVNTLFHVAGCLTRVDALAVWESALRQRAVSAAVLAGVRWSSVAARELAGAASSLSDSGLETIFLEIARSLGIRVRQQVWIDGHAVDALIGDRLVVQLDGFAFHQGTDRRRDIRHDARLVLQGYTVLRFDLHQLLLEREHVVETLRAALAQGLHLARRTPR